jgi:hypothetical protein
MGAVQVAFFVHDFFSKLQDGAMGNANEGSVAGDRQNYVDLISSAACANVGQSKANAVGTTDASVRQFSVVILLLFFPEWPAARALPCLGTVRAETPFFSVAPSAPIIRFIGVVAHIACRSSDMPAHGVTRRFLVSCDYRVDDGSMFSATEFGGGWIDDDVKEREKRWEFELFDQMYES